MSTAPSPRTRVRREPKRGTYDAETIHAILDEAPFCHVAFTDESGQPYCIPTLHARVENRVFIHGSSASRMLRSLRGGVPACLTVTLFDGLVLARSVFEHSVNYRSVVVLGTLEAAEGAEEKLAALEAFTEKLLPGRWQEARRPIAKELKATAALMLDLSEASAKVRTGPPEDGESPDGQLDIWAGVLPARTVYDESVPDPVLRAGIPVPESVHRIIASTQR